jgi:hypothetical protein
MSNKNYYSSFQELTQHRTSELSCYLVEEIKYEIYSRFPRLDDKERKQREEINDLLNNKNISKEETENKIKQFYDTLRKKYTNFMELLYLDDIFIHELYQHVYLYEENKFSSKNKHFSYSLFIKKMIEKTVGEEFNSFLEETVKSLGSNALENNEGFWLNALFDSKYADQRDPSVNDMLKYNKDMTSSSIILTLELFYKGVEKDIYTLLINRTEVIKRIILKVEQRSFWIGNNVQPMVYTDDDEWNQDMNRVVNVFLNCLANLENLQCVSIVYDKNSNFELDKVNTELLSKVLKKHKRNIEVFTIARISLHPDKQEEFLKSLTQLNQVKILIVKGGKLKIEKEFLDRLNPIHGVYLRLSKKVLKVNKN